MPAPIPHYQAAGPLGGDRLQLQFDGPFEGHDIRWDATFLTLERYRREQAPQAGALRNFIDIGERGDTGRRLTVVLDVAAFDSPTVIKAIIMVRQYRRLRVGRHEFGPPRQFGPR